MAKLRELEPMVLKVLENSNESRKDDFLLVLKVYQMLQPLIQDLSFTSVMTQHKFLKLPSIESITRCRRKVMEKHPELRDAAVTELRVEQQEEYIKYAFNFE